MLTTYELDRYVYDALAAGAAGFLLKATPGDRLVEGIRTVAAGEALIAPTLTQRLIEAYLRQPPPAEGVPEELTTLTEREREVLVLMARGRSNDEIASDLVVASATVKTHVNRVLAKLGVATRVQAVVRAFEYGLVRPVAPLPKGPQTDGADDAPEICDRVLLKAGRTVSVKGRIRGIA